MIAQQQRLFSIKRLSKRIELALCNIGLFKNEFKIILFAALKK